MTLSRSAATRPRVPFKLRLKAWWEGCDVIVHRRQPRPGVIETPQRQAIGYRDPERPWETPRVKLAQMLWGEGFSHPGGAEEAIRLVKPFALDPAMTVLDLSAGLGGGPRAVADEFGVWVTGLEQDPEYAEAGMQLSILAGMSKKADVAPFVPAQLELRPGSVDCIVCRELFHSVEDKERLLRVVGQALKPRGQLLFTDYMLADRSRAGSPAIRAWTGTEPTPVSPWALDDYSRCLAEEKLDVRVTEDITEPFRRRAISAWAELTSGTAGLTMTAEFKRCLVAELERWTRRVAAFDCGDLKIYRVYALKPASTKMLSDW